MTSTSIEAPVFEIQRQDPGRLRTALARQLVKMMAGRVPVDILLPTGERLDGRRPANERRSTKPVIVLHRPEEFHRRLADHPKIGVGEAYTAGDWSAASGTDLADALLPFAQRLTSVLPAGLGRLRALVDRPIPDDQLGAREHTQQNIAAHYDLSNDLFAAFLDATLTYSSALFDPNRPVGWQSLAEAQLRKINAVLNRAGVGRGTTVLEIGTGWGTLALEAARRGAYVTTVTLSVEQAALARTRIADAGFADQVDVVVCDYRDLDGQFDAVVSVEMIEAVGERYWPDYFDALARLVRPGGAVALQSILMSHERMLATRRSFGWIQKHIFPGGLIPSMRAIAQHAATAGLVVQDTHHFGTDYAETLRRWRLRFLAEWPTVQALGFDEHFRRTWEFYLAYCEAGFRAGYLDVAQIRFTREGT